MRFLFCLLVEFPNLKNASNLWFHSDILYGANLNSALLPKIEDRITLKVSLQYQIKSMCF